MLNLRYIAALALICAAFPVSAVPSTLREVLPRGGQRGTEVTVKFLGDDIGRTEEVIFREPGISTVALESLGGGEMQATLAIAPDARLGTHALRLRTPFGITNLTLFSVGNLAEAEEAEPNSMEEEAQGIGMGSTVNGVVTAEDVDYFAVELGEGQRLAVEIEAIRLGGALFDPKLRLFGPRGHELIAEDDTQLLRQDAGFVFLAEEAGKHLIAVSDAAYGGAANYRYRLHVGDFPRPLSVMPLGAAPGAEAQLAWLGDPGLGEQTVVVPASNPGTSEIFPALDTKLAPTGQPFRVSTLTATREAEPNNDTASATPGAAPGAFDGLIGEAGDVDCYTFTGTANQALDVQVWARALGSPLDSVLQILKADGSVLAGDDDAAAVDSKVRVTLPEDGTYELRVFDHRRRGGPTFAYRVEAVPVAPQLSVSLVENEQLCLAVPRNNRGYLVLSAARTDFGGPLALEFPELPAGVTAEVLPIPDGQTTIPVLFQAAADAPLAGLLAPIQVALSQEASVPVAGGLKQNVKLVEGQNQITFFGRDVDRFGLAVAEPAPFAITVDAPVVPVVHRGVLALTVRAERAEGFTAPIDLKVPWLPNGFGAGTAQIPEGANEVQMRIECNDGAPVGEHKLLIDARAQGYVVCSPFVTFEAQEPWVNFTIAEATTDQGKPVEVKVTVAARTEFEGEFQADLTNLPKGVTATPQPFNKGTTELVFPLTVAEDAATGKHEQLIIRTTLAANGGEIPHVAGPGKLVVQTPLPPELQAAQPPPAAAAEDQPARKTRFPT